MPTFNSAKSAELQIITWFLEAGWEVFTPVVDANQTDAVVRIPDTAEILSIQIKHKQPGKLNEGMVANTWRVGPIPFHFLIIYQPEKVRGAIIWRDDLRGLPKDIILYGRDRNNYSNRSFRPKYLPASFDLAALPTAGRAGAFVNRLLAIHAKPKPVVV